MAETLPRVSDASLREIDLALAAMADLKPLVEYGVPGTYDSVQARRKTALLRAEGALLFLRRELNIVASEVEAARASLPAPTDADWLKEATRLAEAVEAAGTRRGRLGQAPSDYEPEICALINHLRARPAEPTPSVDVLRQCLEALEGLWTKPAGRSDLPADFLSWPQINKVQAAIKAVQAALNEQAAAHLFPSLTVAQFWCHKASHGEPRCPQECDLCSAETSDDPLLKRLRGDVKKTGRQWHSGPPPHVGWWNASPFQAAAWWRWWDGSGWSVSVHESASCVYAGRCAEQRERQSDQRCILWTDYWPENAVAVPVVKDAPVARTKRAIQACGEWLVACLRLGYSQNDLDALEVIWWKHHDDTGKLIESIDGVKGPEHG